MKTIRSSRKAPILHVIAIKTSVNGNYFVKSLAEQDASRESNFHGIIEQMEVLGSSALADWFRDEEGLHIHTNFRSDMPIVIKVRIG